MSAKHPTHVADDLSSCAKTIKQHKQAIKAHKKAHEYHGALEVQSYRTAYWQYYHVDAIKRHEFIIDGLRLNP